MLLTLNICSDIVIFVADADKKHCKRSNGAVLKLIVHWQINSNATLKNSKRIIQNKDLVNNGQNEKPSFSSLSDQTFKRESSILAQDERWRRA